MLRRNRRLGVGLGLPVWTRALRGGSWNNNQDNARAAYRNNNHPNNRNNNNGFRVALVVPHLIPCLTGWHPAPASGIRLRQKHRFQTCPAVTASGTRRDR
jgi:hypothetical protein